MKWSALALAATLIAPGAALAVTDEEIFRDFRFNLANPGARSLGLGGAFIAVADDATAALANPAGLMLLSRPEFFTEVRNTVVDDSEILDEEIFGPGSPDFTIAATHPSAVFSPSFISYVHPWERFAAGVSRVQLINADNLTRSSLVEPLDPNNPSLLFAISGEGRIQTEVSVWNLSGAVKLGDHVSVGASVAVGSLDILSQVGNFVVNPSATELMYRTTIDDTDTHVSFNAGVHWAPWPWLSVGAVYRGGMEFEVQEHVAEEGFYADLFFDPNFPLSPDNPISPFTTTLNTPDSYGAGVTWHPVNALTVSFDWVHIEYEDLLEGFQPGLNVLTIFGLDPNGFLTFPAAEPESYQFRIEDADEFHLGIEYVFTGLAVPWAVRAGAFTDHNSRLYMDLEDQEFWIATDRTFPERDTEINITVGTGVVVQETFQIDAAASFSDIANEYVVSAIFRF